MRYQKDHKERTHRRILAAASRRFRERGFAGTGVDEVMRAAGLTAGGFYAHFASKGALLRETLATTLGQTTRELVAGLEHLEGFAWLDEVLRRYLSRTHRDAAADGCPLPALSAEVPRQGDEARQAFDAAFAEIVGALERHAPATPRRAARDRTLALVSLCVGGLTLSRAVADRALSDRILQACRRFAAAEADRSAPPGGGASSAGRRSSKEKR